MWSLAIHMASRSLSDLHPDLQPLAQAFLERCADLQVDVLVVCTYRSGAEQDELYAQGRTKPGVIVTRARAGQSSHNHTENGKPAAKAFDAVPLLNGKPIWEDPRDNDGDWTNDYGWKIMGRVAEEVGLDWYGKPGSAFREAPHFQLRRA